MGEKKGICGQANLENSGLTQIKRIFLAGLLRNFNILMTLEEGEYIKALFTPDF